MLHAWAMSIIVAYDMYLEVARGDCGILYKLDKPMSFYKFRERLATQMLAYDPTRGNYPGENAMRWKTQQNIARRSEKISERDKCTEKQFVKAKKSSSNRLCGSLSLYAEHADKFERVDKRVCAFCGERGATYQCLACDDGFGNGVCLHGPTNRDGKRSKMCIVHWHDDLCYGLAKADMIPVLGKKIRDYQFPSFAEFKSNAEHIKKFKLKLKQD